MLWVKMSVVTSTEQAVLIGHPGDDSIAIRVLGRMHPGATDYWDGNWLVSPIEIAVGGFTGRIGAGLRADELRAFRLGLQVLYERLDGEARLKSMEQWLEITITARSGGHLDVRGRAKDEPGMGNQLEFTIGGLDQSFLPEIIGSLEAIEAAFPVFDP